MAKIEKLIHNEQEQKPVIQVDFEKLINYFNTSLIQKVNILH